MAPQNTKTISYSQPTKVPRIHNAAFQKCGLKAYAKALQKYNITPLKDGPFYREDSAKATPQAKHKLEGKYRQSGVNERLRESRGPLKKRNQAIAHIHEGAQTSKKVKYPNPPSTEHSTSKGSEICSEDIQGDSEYLTPVLIGTPWTQYYLDFDTGSSDLWVMGNHCAKEVADPPNRNYYNSKASRSAICLFGETWDINYADGSYASGDVFTDLLNLGGTVVKCQAIERATKCDPSFVSELGDGLMGLGFKILNTCTPVQQNTPVDNMIAQKDIPSPIFTCKMGSCININDSSVDDLSFFTFGMVDKPTLATVGATDFIWSQINPVNGWWQVPSTTYYINGKMYNRTTLNNEAIVDTGTTLWLVDDDLCQAIYNAIPGGTYDPNNGYVFPAGDDLSQLPEIKISIGSTVITVDRRFYSYCTYTDNSGKLWSFGIFQSRQDFPTDIAGDAYLRHVYSCFDAGCLRYGCVQLKTS